MAGGATAGTPLQQLPGGQVADQVAVGGKEIVAGQVVEPDPANLLIDVVDDFARELVHREELQIDSAAVTVVMADSGDARANGGGYAELLVQLAGKGLLGTFTGLDLAAGKLPLQRHGLFRTALTDQHLACAHNERSSHKTEGWATGPIVGVCLNFLHSSSVNAL